MRRAVIAALVLLFFAARTASCEAARAAFYPPSWSLCAFAAAGDTSMPPEQSEEKEKEPDFMEGLCAFQYLVYFFWYSFGSVGAAVVLAADLSTGFTQHYMRVYADWFRERTRGLDRFFARIGCR
jgi:hypothetical protein